MSLSFSFLSFSNALCLTCFWGLVAIESIAAKMNLKYENDDTVISLTTISTSFFWVGFVLDNVVCFTEFIVVWLKVQAPPVSFYWLSAGRYVTYIAVQSLTYILLILNWYENYTWKNIALWMFGHLCRNAQAIGMMWMNKKLSNEVDGINNPVAYAVGLTGNKAMAGA